jgi:putative transposase
MSIFQRLYPDEESAMAMVRHCADARYVWNLGLEQRNLWVHGREVRISSVSQQKELAEARKETWLGEGSSSIQQGALRDLDQAFQNWWKNPGHFERPTWRKAGGNEGFVVRDLHIKQINRKWGEVLVPKVGYIRFRLTRAWSDITSTKSARVTLNRSGQWYVIFVGLPQSIKRQPTGSVVGIDMGVANTVTTSNGDHLQMPVLLSPQEARRKRHLQRRMARQVKGSNRRNRTKQQVAKLCEREAARRKDWIEKTTTELVVEHDLLAIEDLKVKNMVRSGRGKRGLNCTIHAQGWGTFRVRLTDKATRADAPVSVVAVPAKNTSRCCSVCGHTAKENRKSQATFRCQVCKHTEHADVNAAKNILAAGLAVTGRGGTPELVGPMKRQLDMEALV